MMAKLNYLQRYSKAARETFLHTFEGWEEDVHEKLTTVPSLIVIKTKQRKKSPFLTTTRPFPFSGHSV